MLAQRLITYQNDPKAIILALPRGGVLVGFALSELLHLPLDVFITRKLGAPDNPEYALGAVTETGFVYLNQEASDIFETYGTDLSRYLEKVIKIQ